MDENRLFNTSPGLPARCWNGWCGATATTRASSSGRCSTRSRCRAAARATRWSRRMVARGEARSTRTRPVTAAMNGGCSTPVNVSQAVDVVGFNYQIGDYDRFHAAYPGKPMTSLGGHLGGHARAANTPTTDRAPRPTSYDDEAPAWGATHRGRLEGHRHAAVHGRRLRLDRLRLPRRAARPSAGRRRARPSGSWTSAASRRPPSTSTRRSG